MARLHSMASRRATVIPMKNECRTVSQTQPSSSPAAANAVSFPFVELAAQHSSTPVDQDIPVIELEDD